MLQPAVVCENAELGAQLQGLGSALEETEERINELEDGNTSIQDAVERVTSELSAAKEEIVRLEAERSNAKFTALGLRLEQDLLHSRLRITQDTVNQADRNVDKLQERLDTAGRSATSSSKPSRMPNSRPR